MKRSSFLAMIMLLIPVFAFGDTVKIGLAHVFSGPMATFGEVAEQGVRLAVKRVNEKGGLLGRNLEVIKADTEAKPDAGLKAVERLVTKDRVDAIVGIVSSAVALKVTPEMDRLKTPLIITHAMADQVTGSKCSPWVFRMTWSTREALKGAALLAKSELKSDTWTTLGPDYGFGQETWDLFQKYLGELGPYKFVNPNFSPMATKDWKPYIEKLNAAGAKGVLVSLWGNNLRDFIKQANAEKFFEGKDVICVVGGGVEVFWALGFLDMPVGVWFGTPYWQGANESPTNREFIAEYMNLSSSQVPPSYSAYTAYASVIMYAEAVKKAGTTDKTSVAKALEGLRVELPGGPTTFRPGDHQAVFPLVFGRSSDQASRSGKRYRRLTPLKIFPGEDLLPKPEDTGCVMKSLN
ncbi:ABC transporter substrate-binding protein [Desulfomonile tiedjei]|uniref:Amino acid/amide ABC transporter substrate-binding protein, HAAT family n=1 Tax=Desulfomonile tiedjei (strain ATCC 49306 / DSM 6799 / DCB-1) TaxID=706587 RepID=I4CED9_DESTA|nr:ABC transporter substrate-binding protein [Desulfomonile tiedjei]AFM27930.1 amino acid/amide ABC transporter substrate-binding protein, HAAT family [Desulfomonile tiedjei DSM 6799]